MGRTRLKLNSMWGERIPTLTRDTAPGHLSCKHAKASPKNALMTFWTSPIEITPSPLQSAPLPGGWVPRNMLMACCTSPMETTPSPLASPGTDGFAVTVTRQVYQGGDLIRTNTWISNYARVNGLTLVGAR